MNKFNFLFLFTIWCGHFSFGQIPGLERPLKEFVDSGILTAEDLTGYRITDSYTSNKSGIKYVYIQQTIDEVPIDLAINSIHIDKKGIAKIQDNRFIKNARKMVLVESENISPLESLQKAAIDLGYSDQNSLRSIINTRAANVFSATFSENEIEVTKVYVLKNNHLILSYQMNIDEKANSDSWDIKVDIATGKVIEKNNHTVYCNVNLGRLPINRTSQIPLNKVLKKEDNWFADMASYRVYPLPATNPTDGFNEMIFNPHIPIASPFGWHDNDGIEGAEFTITRGNNVHGYTDLTGKNSSSDDEPDGGSSLVFDFPHKINEDPENSKEPSTVNLFYAANMAHDLSYLLGFQEEDGNYQDNNYGKGGQGGDYVRVESMDGSGRNNANFSITSDGNPGRMQMYLFDKIRSLVTIESPPALVDNNFEAAEANFGEKIKNSPVLANIVQALNNDPDFPNQGCSPIISNVAGKIAMIDRGSCDFSEKVFNVQEAGAVMAIICNIAGVNGGDGEDIFTMGAGAFASSVNIPSVMMKKSDCDLIKIALNTGQNVILSAKERPVEGPLSYDASFDNGISLHEYVHGISTRLTGGPSQIGCLNNVSEGNGDRKGDQMGEGWSDFFALVWTTKTGDIGSNPRGMGNYVLGEAITDKGIRSYPYSTDLGINPLTYGDIKVASIPHGVGTVWATMLWDLYWSYIETYGFDPDYHNEESGNFKAAFTIMEAMKIQPCRPGFVDGRNAILEADQLLYGGENETRIWEVFARRGLGFYADQGSTIDHRDGKEDFTIPPFIAKEIVIDQVTTKNVRPGEQIDVKLSVTNFTGSVHNNGEILVQIPNGLSYVEGSSNIEPVITKADLSFSLGVLENQEVENLSFSLETSSDIASIRRFYDDVESGVNGWFVDQRKGTNIWRIDNAQSLSGNFSWYVPESGEAENLQRLISPTLNVIGEWPVLRFWHNYNIKEAINGGFIEITQDGGQNWDKITDKLIIRNRYSNELPYLAFGIPNLEGYSGVSPDQKFIDSYIDLTSYKGSQIQLRFRFSQQPGFASSDSKAGWVIDDIELMDLKTYTITACFVSNENQIQTCATPAEIVINTQTLTDVKVLDNDEPGIIIYPNPANETLYVDFASSPSNYNQITIFNAVGKEVFQTEISKGIGNIEINTSKFLSGTYFLKIGDVNKEISRSFQVLH